MLPLDWGEMCRFIHVPKGKFQGLHLRKHMILMLLGSWGCVSRLMCG